MALIINEWNTAVCPYCDTEFNSLDLEEQLEDAGAPRTNTVMMYRACDNCNERVELTVTYKISAYAEAR